jgi:signal transduction histidine kinase
LRRITRTAAAIERGGFDVELRPGFADEIGSLAGTIDRMRLRLGEVFAELKAERDKLEVLLDRLREGVIAFDESLTVQFVNVSTRAILGKRSPAVGDRLPESAAGVPLRESAAGLFSANTFVNAGEHTTESGAIVSLVGVPSGGSKLGALVLTDVTEAELLRRAEREFIANASHELRTPIAAISSAVEALESGAAHETESRTSFIDLIGRQSNRMTRVTNSLLAVARAQTLDEEVRLVPVRLLPLLTDVLNGIEPADSNRVRVECPATLAALAEPAILEHVVANLLRNAVLHAASSSITLSARLIGKEAVIEVADQGPGISAARLPRVFDRFRTGSEGGSRGFGLGLAITLESVNAIGGRIELESGEGEGTLARVTLLAARTD